MFNYNFIEKEEGTTLLIDLEGEFDTAGAQEVQSRLESYNTDKINKVIFGLEKVTLMASSGLRVIFYAKDKIKEEMKVELYKPKDLVAKIIKMSGMHKFVDVV